MYTEDYIVEGYRAKAKVYEGLVKEQSEIENYSMVFFVKIKESGTRPVYNPYAMEFLEKENHFAISLMGKISSDKPEGLSGLSECERKYIYDVLDKKAEENKNKYNSNEFPNVRVSEKLYTELNCMPKVKEDEKQQIIELYQMAEVRKNFIAKSEFGVDRVAQFLEGIVKHNFHQVVGFKEDFEENTSIYEAFDKLESKHGKSKFGIVLVN